MSARLLVREGSSVADRLPEDLSDLRDRPCWLDIVDPKPEDLTLVAEELGLHPLAVEDALHGGQRPKADEYPGHLFIAFFALESPDPDVVVAHEISIFVAPNVVVTVRRADFEARREVERRWRDGRIVTSTQLLYELLDHIVDGYFPIVDQFGERLELLERLILEDTSGRQFRGSLAELLHLKSDLLHMRKQVAPGREVISALTRETSLLDREHLIYFQDVYDHVVRVNDEIDTFRDLASNVIDAHLAAASNRLNEVMKVLTSLATVLLVMSVITGFFGQNFAHIPYDSDVAFWGMVVALVVSAAALAAYFRRRGWL